MGDERYEAELVRAAIIKATGEIVAASIAANPELAKNQQMVTAFMEDVFTNFTQLPTGIEHTGSPALVSDWTTLSGSVRNRLKTP